MMGARSASDGTLPLRVTSLDLFPTRAWSADLTALEPHRERLVTDAWGLLSDPLPGQPGLQSSGTLQDRPEPWWRECIGAVTEVTDALASQLRPPAREREVFSWVLGHRSEEDYEDRSGLERDIDNYQLQRELGFGHTHTAATFSSVLYLQVPPEMTDTGATVFRDPQYALHHRLGGETLHRFLPQLLRLIVFPGYVEHYPEPPVIAGAWSCPRLILSTDLVYY